MVCEYDREASKMRGRGPLQAVAPSEIIIIVIVIITIVIPIFAVSDLVTHPSAKKQKDY